jgi:hypothetical protein
MSSIAFLRRQSPDWQALARDHRRGVPIDPARFVPDHPIPGFPPRIETLIGAWNARFRTDFFTFRALLVRLSAANLAAVSGVDRYADEQVEEVAERSHRTQFYLLPHDDDDFFAPYLARVIEERAHGCDAFVTPLFRIGPASWTFVPPGCTPEYVLGEARAQDFRFQTNNYAVHSRRLGDAGRIRAIEDHIEASAYAHAQSFTEATAAQVLSATVKTPASASTLAKAFQSRLALRRAFARTIDGLHSVELPQRFDWIGRPCQRIASWLEAVYRGEALEPSAEIK